MLEQTMEALSGFEDLIVVVLAARIALAFMDRIVGYFVEWSQRKAAA